MKTAAHRIHLQRLCVYLALLLGTFNVQAQQPLFTRNQHPLTQIVGIPVAKSGALESTGTWRSSFVFNISNDAIVENNTTERLIIDGENIAAEFATSYGVSDSLQLGLVVPIVGYSGGFLDGPITEFHELFNFPGGDRHKFEDDQIRYLYQRDGVTLLEQTKARSGLGDIRINAGFALGGLSSENRHVALHTELKLPSGDEDALLGSGSTDLSIALAASYDRFKLWPLLSFTANIGVVARSGIDVLTTISRDIIYFGAVSAEVPLTNDLTAIVQIDMHSSVYDSELSELGAASGQLVIGGRWVVSDRSRLDFGFSEDPATDTSMDITFFTALHCRY